MQKKIIIFFLCAAGVVLLGLFYINGSEERFLNPGSTDTSFDDNINTSTDKILVEIQGEVQNPNLYEVDKKSRIFHLINLAGGLTDKADLRGINRALELNDQDKIVIPSLYKEESYPCENYNNPNLICVRVSGNIQNPGNYFVTRNSPFGQVIFLAGGLKEIDYSYLNQIKNQNLTRSIAIELLYDSLNGGVNFKTNINSATLEELSALTGIGKLTAEKIVEHRKKNRFMRIEDIMKVDGIGEGKFEQIKDFITV